MWQYKIRRRVTATMDGYDPAIGIQEFFVQHFDEDVDWNQRFRLQSATFQFLLDRIGHHFEPPTQRSQAVSASHQILTAVRYMTTNSVYHMVRAAHGRSEATICQIINKVVAAINEELCTNCGLFHWSARWPGSVNVARVLRRSSVYQEFEIKNFSSLSEEIITF